MKTRRHDDEAGPAMIVLYMLGRVNLEMLGVGILDMTIGALFIAAFLRTPKSVGG